jgi:hypothetical protein
VIEIKNRRQKNTPQREHRLSRESLNGNRLNRRSFVFFYIIVCYEHYIRKCNTLRTQLELLSRVGTQFSEIYIECVKKNGTFNSTTDLEQ